MFTNLFGNYLVDKGYIDTEQLAKIKAAQAKTRVKLGLIAVTEKLITQQQADAINVRQMMEDRRFGDIAVEMGLLTKAQVKHLLNLQGAPYVQFTQAVTDMGLVSVDLIEETLREYQKSKGYTSADIEAIKSGDIDRIMPLLLPDELPWSTAEHVAVVIRTLNRIVCDDIYVKKTSLIDVYDSSAYALQHLFGDFESSTAISGSYEGMMTLAEGFAKDKFAGLDLEALDSIAEFINIVDGLFATAISHDMIDVSLYPPELSEEGKRMKAEKICLINLLIAGHPVDLLISTGSQMVTSNK